MKITWKAARVNAGLTQSEVINKMNINKGTLINYEKYRTIPDINVAVALASLYGMSVDDIIFLPSDCALSTTNT